MADQSSRSRAVATGERVYDLAFRVVGAVIVLVTFAGLAYLVSINQLDGGALILYAGVILGYILSSIVQRRRRS